MKLWVTEIRAMRPSDGELINYAGPNVPGFTHRMAQQYCEENELGYCKVIGQLIAEIPTKGNTLEADFDNAKYFDSEDN